MAIVGQRLRRAVGCHPMLGTLTVPDGTINAADRMTVAWVYPVTGAVDPSPTCAIHAHFTDSTNQPTLTSSTNQATLTGSVNRAEVTC